MSDLLKVIYVDPVTGDDHLYSEHVTDGAAYEAVAKCRTEKGIDDVRVEWPPEREPYEDYDCDEDGEKERCLIAEGKL